MEKDWDLFPKEKEIEKIIPLEEGFMVKKVDDRVYGFLQVISYKGINERGEEVYFCYKSGLLDNIAKTLRINKRAVRNKIDNMIKVGYLSKDRVATKQGDDFVDGYILEKVTIFQKVNKDTLEELVLTLQDHVIKTYAYLLNAHLYINKRYTFSKKELINNCLGVDSVHNKTDYKIIDACLNLLQRLGLLVLEDKKTKKHINDKTTFYYQIKEVKTKLPELKGKTTKK